MNLSDRLKELLHYEPSTGVFTWKICSGRAQIGAVAGHINKPHGYHVITIDGKKHKAHRLAWLYVHGSIPDEQIDHKNRVRTDNRIDNLRPADQFTNMANAGDNARNTSGFKGVAWHEATQKWTVRLTVKRKTIYLGEYAAIETAASVRANAEKEYLNV